MFEGGVAGVTGFHVRGRGGWCCCAFGVFRPGLGWGKTLVCILFLLTTWPSVCVLVGGEGKYSSRLLHLG